MSIQSRKNKKSKTQHLAGNTPRASRSLAWFFVVPVFLLLATTAPWQRTIGNFFAPYLLLSENIGSAAADQTLKMRSRTELANEVMRLNLENIRLTGEVKKLKKLEAENVSLRAMLDLKAPPGYDYLTCSVILRDPWMWDVGFTIDRGSNDGLEPGLAVIAPAPDKSGRVIMLGVIESVSKRSARVMTVVNPQFRMSAYLPESGTVGFLNAGNFEPSSGGTATIGFLPANKTFVLNELIFTTEFESSIPPDLWLGTLESIEPASIPYGNRLYRRGVMRPAGNLENLRTVIVARIKKNN